MLYHLKVRAAQSTEAGVCEPERIKSCQLSDEKSPALHATAKFLSIHSNGMSTTGGTHSQG